MLAIGITQARKHRATVRIRTKRNRDGLMATGTMRMAEFGAYTIRLNNNMVTIKGRQTACLYDELYDA